MQLTPDDPRMPVIVCAHPCPCDGNFCTMLCECTGCDCAKMLQDAHPEIEVVDYND